jgi:hypothetical protein
VIQVLEARGLVPGVRARKRILGSTNAREIDRWLTKAATAQSVAQVLGPARPRAAKARKG